MRLYDKSYTADCSCTLETLGKRKSSNGYSTAVLTVFILLSFPSAIIVSRQSTMTKNLGYTLYFFFLCSISASVAIIALIVFYVIWPTPVMCKEIVKCASFSLLNVMWKLQHEFSKGFIVCSPVVTFLACDCLFHHS